MNKLEYGAAEKKAETFMNCKKSGQTTTTTATTSTIAKRNFKTKDLNFANKKTTMHNGSLAPFFGYKSHSERGGLKKSKPKNLPEVSNE